MRFDTAGRRIRPDTVSGERTGDARWASRFFLRSQPAYGLLPSTGTMNIPGYKSCLDGEVVRSLKYWDVLGLFEGEHPQPKTKEEKE